MVNRSAIVAMSTSVLKALPGKLDIKRHSPSIRSRLLISSLPGSALRMHVESLGKPRDVNKRSQSLAWST